MKNVFLLALFLFSSIPNQLFGIGKRGHEVGNGGLLIFCQNHPQKSVNDHLMLYDHFLWHTHNTRHSMNCQHSYNLENDYELYIKKIIEKINLNPKKSNKIFNADKISEYTERILEASTFENFIAVTSDYEFNKKYGRDSMPSPFCHAFQVAIQTQNPLKVRLNVNLWNRLDEEQKAWLLIHEALYLYEIETNPTTSSKMLKNLIQKMTLAQDLYYK